MKPEVLQEEEYFNRYYPKEFGNWRELYNIQAYKDACAEGKDPGVCWMCYKKTGIVLSGSDIPGCMKIISWSVPVYIESFFISGAGAYLCPYKTLDKKTWGQVTLRKMESNLPIFVIHIGGCDDSSYSIHCMGEDEARKVLGLITENGIEDICFLTSLGFFFTN